MEADILNKYYCGNTLLSYLILGIIIVLGLLIKRFLATFLSSTLYKFFRKYSQGISVQHFRDLLVKPVERLITYLIFYTAINQINYPLNEILFKRRKFVITYGELIDKIFLLLIIWALFKILFKIIDFVAEVFAYKASLTDSKSDDQLVPFLKELTKILTYIIQFFVMLGLVFDVNIPTVLTGFGIGGVALALAAKESLENLLGSFAIFLDKPFVVGDLVRVENIEGTIEKVGFRSTRIRTLDKSIITLPNKKLIDGLLDNLTLRNYRRLKFNISLAYNTPSEILKKIAEDIKDCINKHPTTNDETVVVFESFGEFSLNVQVLYFIEMMDYAPYAEIKEEINYAILDIVQKHQAEFAVPIRKVINIEEDKNNLSDAID